MATSIPPLGELLEAAGWDLENERVGRKLIAQVTELWPRIEEDAKAAMIAVLRALRERDHARRQCSKAAEAATELERLVQKLVEGESALCRFERMGAERDGLRQLWCRFQGQLSELPVHPEVTDQDLAALQSWHFVRVDPRERVVVGVCADEELLVAALGEVVAFKGLHDGERGLVRIARHGEEEEVVQLAPALRGEELAPGALLVLQRDDARRAIARLPPERMNSRFEVAPQAICGTLADLAGLEEVIEPFFTRVVLPFLHPETFGSFGVHPLRGALLYSYLPGQGKTATVRGLAGTLKELGAEHGFDFALYHVKPNELKIVWHGGDARLVRDELCGALRARRRAARTRPLFQLVALDEIDSLGKRAGGDDGGGVFSAAQNDAVQALLVEMDGMVRERSDGPPAHTLWVGLTNRPDLLDEALKRPGRFGDLVCEIPPVTIERAEGILALYACRQARPWYLDGAIRRDLEEGELRARILRPALERVFHSTVLHFSSEHRRAEALAAGRVMAGVHYEEALNSACQRAAERAWRRDGAAAVAATDLVEALFDQACGAAGQMAADRRMLARQLHLQGLVTRVDPVPREELCSHVFVRGLTA